LGNLLKQGNDQVRSQLVRGIDGLPEFQAAFILGKNERVSQSREAGHSGRCAG